jgi:protein gp37
MSAKSSIEWCDATWNPIVGCSIVSPGCKNCYAMAQASRMTLMNPGLEQYRGVTKVVDGKAVWTGEVNVAPETKFLEPLRWKKPRRVFVNSMSDLFHENVADETIDRAFAVMALCPQHTFQILTKRPVRMRKYFEGRRKNFSRASDALMSISTGQREDEIQSAADWLDIFDAGGRPLPNVWLGVTAERQQEADERIPELLATPAAVRFVSIEPMLGSVDLMDIPWPDGRSRFPETDFLPDGRSALHIVDGARLDWVICGGESGSHARPMDPNWPRALRDQCAAAGVPFFFKQWGEFLAGEEVKDAKGSRIEFGDGGVFRVMSDGEDILLNCAQEHRGEPRKLWKNYWASGDGRLLRRASKHVRLLDGREHNDFPFAKSEADAA